MSTKIFRGAEAREKLLAGMKEVFDAVSPTFGGNGRNVVFNKWSGTPVASNDGENIADQVIPEDLSLQQGANLLKQVARNTNAELEDGSTATIINSYTLAKNGVEMLNSNTRISPMKLRKEMKDATEKVLVELKNSVVTLQTLEDLEKLAITSVESEEYGKIIAKTIYEAGDNGIVYVNEHKDIGISVEQDEGYQFRQGLLTPYLIKNPDRMETVLEDVAVLITDVQINFPTNEFLGLMEELVAKQGRKNILIVCDEIDPRLVKFAVQNMFAGKFNLMLVKKPMQKEYLEDIAAIVGATAMTGDKGMIFPKIEYFGNAKKVVLNMKNTTIFIDDSKITGAVGYVNDLKAQLAICEDEVSKIKLEERVARLTGKIFILNVGAKTEAALKHLRDKVDDAVNSLKKVWKVKDDGVVTGGGTALFKAGQKLLKGENLTNGEFLIYHACSAPLLQLLRNGGEDDIILEKIEENGGGYNAITMEYEPDMVKAGIVDATKVISTSFSNASDFAGDFITYEVLITPLPEVAQNNNPVV